MQLPEWQEGWWKWGEPAKRKTLEDYPRFKIHLEGMWNIDLSEKIHGLKKPAVVGNDENSNFCINIFTKAVPTLHISDDVFVRLKRSFGKSYMDLLAVASGSEIKIVDAVVSSQSHQEVTTILHLASLHQIVVVPFGGGTNVVGAFKLPASTSRPCISLDLSKMNRLVDIDVQNQTATFQTGIFGPELEKILNEKGFTLGHFPQSFEYSTLGGWIATSSAGQESSSYGRIQNIVIAMKVAVPGGTVSTNHFEADAEGINIKSLFFGSEGTLGIVTEAQLRIHKLPDYKTWVNAIFPDYQCGLNALKTMTQSGVFPSIVRFSDDSETYLLTLLSHKSQSVFSRLKSSFIKQVIKWKHLSNPCMMMVRIDGTREECNTKKKQIRGIFGKGKSLAINESVGKKWEANRYGLPYLLDDMIERGIFVDTVETVLPWNKINDVRLQIYQALKVCREFGKENGIVISHVSHVYHTSASIYFTLITQCDQLAPRHQWQLVKSTIMDIILSHGGAVSHHHSIGTDLKPWYLKKTDEITRTVLRSIKDSLDPNHILNPGKLFDDQE